MPASELTTVRLRFRGADVFLAPGQYLLGRSASCQLVLDHPRVSRRHARLVVHPDWITVEDLDSANGVFVNGERITGVRHIESGAQVLVGGELLELHVEPPEGSLDGRATQVSMPSVAPASSSQDWELADSASAGTQKAEVFELVGRVADRALAEGRADEAESVLRAHLTKVLDQAKRGIAIVDSTRSAALHYALELALATGNGRWLDYVIELHAAVHQIIPEALHRELQGAIPRVAPVPSESLETYARALGQLPDGADRARARERLESLRRTAQAKR